MYIGATFQASTLFDSVYYYYYRITNIDIKIGRLLVVDLNEKSYAWNGYDKSAFILYEVAKTTAGAWCYLMSYFTLTLNL